MSILDWNPVARMRRNHALEHATLQVLAERNPRLMAAGYSDTRGFWIVGDLSTEEVYEAVEQALARLNAGEYRLAIHPNCGTNFAAAGFAAGTVGWLASLNMGRDWRSRLERWSIIVPLVTLALILVYPLGSLIQQRITTAPPVGMRVLAITRQAQNNLIVHRVLTRG
jgi:hypothetical protein